MLRREVDNATTVTDAATDAQEIAIIARDAIGDESAYLAVIAQIPAIKLGRTTYRVISGGRVGLELLGPRGGSSSLIRNEKNPELWAHVTMAGLKSRSQWYRRETNGTFTAI